MGVFAPATRFRNLTGDGMVLITLNARGNVEGKKVIAPGCHVDLGYRNGIGRIGGDDVTFMVTPESRSGVPGKEMFPFTVFEYATVDVVYKSVNGSGRREYEDGAYVDFDFKKDTLFRRIGLVRRLAGVFAGFGNCYYAAAVPAMDLAPAKAIVSVISGLAQAPTQISIERV